MQISSAKRQSILTKQIELLDRAAEKNFSDDYDIKLAKSSDLQGIGGVSF